MRPCCAYLALLLLLPACRSTGPEATPSTIIFLTSTADTGLPFSEVVQVDNLLFLSGQLGINPATNQLAPGGIAAETSQAMTNIRNILERHGASMERVVKCTVMLADIREWPAMNEAYVAFFPQNEPARSAFGADGLALGARVEIECIAAL